MISFKSLCTTQQEIPILHRYHSHSYVQHNKIHLFLTTSFKQLCTIHQAVCVLHDFLHSVVYNRDTDIYYSQRPSHSCVQQRKKHLFLTTPFTQLCTTHRESFISHGILHICVQHRKRHFFLTTSFTQMCRTQQETSLPHDTLHTFVYNTARDIYSLHPSHSCVQHSKRHLFLTSFTQLCTTQQETSIHSHRL